MINICNTDNKNNLNEINSFAKDLLGKKLVTHQTGPEGREVKKIYIEEACHFENELYLSCLIDRSSSKIAFISSAEGGMDIEKVARKNPEKIVNVKLQRSSNRAHVIIEDNGPGIPEDQYKNVFKPFFRLDKSRSLNKSGVGLGLAIVEDIINSHGGNIQLSRSQLGGLRVKISLPF